MSELDRRLQEGPLAVGTLFSPERAASVSLRALRKRRRRVQLAVVALAACALFTTLRLVREPLAAPGSPASVRLADGSSVQLHDTSSTLLTEHISAQRVRLRLSGGARFDVVPNRARTFEVVTASLSVRVLGTIFSLEPEGARTRVSVERGSVQVIWQSGAALLTEGEASTFPPTLQPSREASSPPAPTTSVGSSEEPRASRQLPEPAPARAGRSARELILAADVARSSGQPEAAVAALTELIRRYPRDRRAPVASFTLGRVLLDELGRSAEAAEAFERADALWPSGPLAERALARAVEAHQRAGDAARTRALAEQYLKRFAQGSRAEAMRAILRP